MDISIINFTENHARDSSAMINRVLDASPEESFTAASLQGNKEFYAADKLLKRESSKWKTFLGVSDSHDVVGTISLCLNKNWLYGLWVDIKVQRVGIGKKLVARLIQEAQQSKISAIGVSSVIPSLPFYKKMGFIQTHHHDSEEFGEL